MRTCVAIGLALTCVASTCVAQSVTIDLGSGIYITSPTTNMGTETYVPIPNQGTPIWQQPTPGPTYGQPTWQQPAPTYVPQSASPYIRR